MSKYLLVAVAGALVAPCMAADLGLKPGLWQVTPMKQVVDGQDHAQQASAAYQRAQQSLANLPPEQRAQVQAMMAQRGMTLGQGGGTSIKFCMSAQMAKRNALPDEQPGCTRSYSSSGGVTTFTFSCTRDGNTSAGTGQVRRSGDTITTVVDGTTSGKGGSHTTHSETQLQYLGADCGDVKPVDTGK